MKLEVISAQQSPFKSRETLSNWGYLFGSSPGTTELPHRPAPGWARTGTGPRPPGTRSPGSPGHHRAAPGWVRRCQRDPRQGSCFRAILPLKKGKMRGEALLLGQEHQQELAPFSHRQIQTKQSQGRGPGADKTSATAHTFPGSWGSAQCRTHRSTAPATSAPCRAF